MRRKLQNKWKIQDFKRNEFKFCGLWVTKEKGCIYIEQEKYADMVDDIPMTRFRASQVTQKMIPSEIKSVQSIAGAANWMATQTRPDLSFDVSELVGLIAHDGTVQCMKRANKLVKRMKSNKGFCLKSPKKSLYLWVGDNR